MSEAFRPRLAPIRINPFSPELRSALIQTLTIEAPHVIDAMPAKQFGLQVKPVGLTRRAAINDHENRCRRLRIR